MDCLQGCSLKMKFLQVRRYTDASATYVWILNAAQVNVRQNHSLTARVANSLGLAGTVPELNPLSRTPEGLYPGS